MMRRPISHESGLACGTSGWFIPARFALTLSFAVLTACHATPAAAPNAPPVAPSAAASAVSQPANVGDAKAEAVKYHDSDAYEHDLEAVGAQALSWINQESGQATRPALVLDIDETSLSNWDVIKADDFGYIVSGDCASLPKGPCGWTSWDLLGRDPAIAPTLEVFRQARKLGMDVFFITGRPESQRAATERNLAAAGYVGYAHLYMKPDDTHFASAADYKTPIRAHLESSGYTIVANIGDQPSDLAGGHALRTFLLPDPFYRIP